jgi:hypothetical protein
MSGSNAAAAAAYDFILTDYQDAIVDNANFNLRLCTDLRAAQVAARSQTQPDTHEAAGPSRALVLDWTESSRNAALALQLAPLQYVVAADVLYDRSVVPDLVRTVVTMLKHGGGGGGGGDKDQMRVKCLIVATLRNEDTLELFFQSVVAAGCAWSDVTAEWAPATLTATTTLHEGVKDDRAVTVTAVAATAASDDPTKTDVLLTGALDGARRLVHAWLACDDHPLSVSAAVAEAASLPLEAIGSETDDPGHAVCQHVARALQGGHFVGPFFAPMANRLRVFEVTLV